MADTGKKILPAAPGEGLQETAGEGFASRWSRLKREARERPVENSPSTVADPGAPPPELPPPEMLTFDSDYSQFFHPKVGEDVRRAALKKLFTDPHFNVMDGLDVYIDDYSKTEPIPAAMLAGLRQAQNIFQWAKEDAEERERAAVSAENHPREADPEQAVLESPEPQPESSDVPGAKASEPAPVGTSDTSSQTRS